MLTLLLSSDWLCTLHVQVYPKPKHLARQFSSLLGTKSCRVYYTRCQHAEPHLPSVYILRMTTVALSYVFVLLCPCVSAPPLALSPSLSPSDSPCLSLPVENIRKNKEHGSLCYYGQQSLATIPGAPKLFIDCIIYQDIKRRVEQLPVAVQSSVEGAVLNPLQNHFFLQHSFHGKLSGKYTNSHDSVPPAPCLQGWVS